MFKLDQIPWALVCNSFNHNTNSKFFILNIYTKVFNKQNYESFNIKHLSDYIEK